MSLNLVLGLFALVVGCVTLLVRFVLPAPSPSVHNPYPRLILSGWLPVLSFGVVPLLASAAFFGAWWMEGDGPPPAVQPMRYIDATSKDTDATTAQRGSADDRPTAGATSTEDVTEARATPPEPPASDAPATDAP
ncbi:MAG: hypothetical protein H6733_14920 [Alphaproteobacteria bacterium]|nr:hypothetical protein [Alphaproteobacteria bacterium]